MEDLTGNEVQASLDSEGLHREGGPASPSVKALDQLLSSGRGGLNPFMDEVMEDIRNDTMRVIQLDRDAARKIAMGGDSSKLSALGWRLCEVCAGDGYRCSVCSSTGVTIA